MDYNTVAKALLLMVRNNEGVNVPFTSLMPSYGPFESLEAVRTDLINTFGVIENVPRGYTFCVIENNKPQEYWFTKKGDWSSIEKKNTSSGSSVVSTAIFRSTDEYLQVSYDNGSTWNNLVSLESLRGPAGINGTDGKNGKDGAEGPQGPVGPAGTVDTEGLIRQVANNFGMQIIRSTYTDDNDEVHYEYKVQYRFFGTWITATGSIKELGGGGGGGSTPIIRIVTGDDGNKYWEIDGAIVVDEYNHPVRANGIDGENGADGRDGRDGEDAEAEYTKFKSIAFIRSNTTPSTPPKTDGTYEDPVPRASGWFDGIPATDAYGNAQAKLWMTTRWFSKDPAFMEISSYWSAPQPATDTADIDLEYSNAPLDISLDLLGNPTGNPYSASNPNGWYDANGVSAAFLSQANWQAIRTMKNGVWGAWSIYKTRGENGMPGISPAATFKTHVYMRSNAKMATTDPQYDASRANDDRLPSSLWPVGGSYISPIPTNTDGLGNPIWHDGIPAGKEMIWESVGVVVSNSDALPEWSEPAPVSDTQFMDFEWCDVDPLPNDFKKPSRTSYNDDASGRLPGDPWYDDPNRQVNPNPVWKAERPVRNGEYVPGSDWFVYRVRGENGTQGTSISIKGHLFGVYGPAATHLEDAETDFLAHYAEYGTAKYAIFGDPDNWTKIYEFSIVDGEVVYNDITSQMREGYTYMYNGDGYIWDGDNFFNAGRIQGPEGPAGQSQYIHIKYSNDPRVLTDPANAEFSGNNGEVPGSYVGTCVDTNPDDDNYRPDRYTWKKWNGEDGWGYEYIFTLTSKDSVDSNGNPIAPPVPTEYSADKTSDFQRDDYVPDHDGWTDDPQSPYKRMPYCWVAYRQKISGLWTKYKGSASNNALAALFSMYSSRGRGLDGIAEKYAVWNNPINGPAIDSEAWQDGIPEFDPDAGYIYLWNYEIISYDDGTTTPTPPACIGFWQEGMSIQRIEEFYYASSIDSVTGLPGYHVVATNNNNEFGFSPQGNPAGSWNRDPDTQRLSKDKIYLWNYEVVTFRKGNQSLSDDQKYFVSKPVIIAYYNYTDVEYLIKIFKKVEGDENTAYLGGLIGAVDENQKIQAMLNATDIGKDDEHGKLYIAAGVGGLSGTDTQKSQKAQNATFKVYEDGHVAMRSAELQGYLTQHFRRVHDVSKYLAETGSGTVARYLDKSKLSNALLLGWNTLSFTEDNETIEFSNSYQVNLSTIITSERAGRVIFSNQLYVSKNGTVFSNNNFGKTQLVGYFILPNGTITSGSSGVLLLGGWIEVIKVSSLDKDMQLIVPQLTTMNNLYIVTGWGGSVRFTEVETMLNVNENQAVVSNASIGFNVTEARSKTTYVPDNVNVFRVTEFTRNVLVIGDNTADTLYIVVPNFDSEVFFDQAMDDIQFNVLFNTHHRRIVFKEEVPGANTSIAEVPNLPNLISISLQDIIVPRTEGTPDTTLFRAGLRLTYIPGCNYTVVGQWLAEDIIPKIF